MIYWRLLSFRVVIMSDQRTFMESARLSLISLGAHANYICLRCHPHAGCEKVFRLIWYQRGAEVFPWSHEGAAPPGPPSGLAFNGLSAG